MVNKNLRVNNQTKLNLKNDVIFKTFFSRKGNEEYLIDFLNALLKIEIKSITIQEEVNLEKLAIEEKGGRLDLQAELNNGIIVNIELQIKNEHNIEERTTFYSEKVNQWLAFIDDYDRGKIKMAEKKNKTIEKPNKDCKRNVKRKSANRNYNKSYKINGRRN